MPLSRHSWPVVAIRTPFCIVAFIMGAVAIRLLQGLDWMLFRLNPRLFHLIVNVTKVHFVTLLTFLTSIINPTKIVVTYNPKDLPESNSFLVDSNGNLISALSPNSVWISNHQIYTDWLFLWFVNYTGHFGDSVYIVLKANLATIPLLGRGMQVYKFLFLSRKWENDKVTLTNQLLEIDADARGLGPASGVRCILSTNPTFPGVSQWPKGSGGDIWPYQMIIFPEGTVKSPHTRVRSDKFVASLNRPLLKHVLLPRVRGIFLMLRLLRDTIEVVYDVTCGYGGLKPEEYGEDVFTLKAFYLLGYGPKSVVYHIRAWKIKDIPLGDDDLVDVDKVDPTVLKQFEEWLFNVWYEKDRLMDTFYKTGTFAEDSETKVVTADFKLRHWWEAFSPYMVFIPVLIAIRLFVKVLWSLVG